MKKYLLILFSLFLFLSCNNEYLVVDPQFSDKSILTSTKILSEDQFKNIEGIYNITVGKQKFGGEVVVKFNGKNITIFGQKLGAYLILDVGESKNEILFEGKWRYAQTTEVGLVRFSITEENGSDRILNNLSDGKIIINGTYSENDNNLSQEVQLEFARKFSEKVLNKDFYILAHRGGGRTTDNLGVSENTIEMINLSEQLCANGIEIDVKLSKDNVPFLYHDISLNLRTTEDTPIWGPIEDFTFKQINSFITLKYGEKIPSLEEALDFVVKETNLKIVWLDMKSEKNAMPYVIPIQQAMLSEAEKLGRDIQILIGLPDDLKFDNFINYDNYQTIPSLCELSSEQVLKANSKIWAPRWTLGFQTEATTQLQNSGKKVFTWTLDQSQFIEEYIKNSSFDGILTNYPTLVAYYYYVQE